MATVSDSTDTPVIPFPIDRARKPQHSVHAIESDWIRTRNVAMAACVFRGLNEGDAIATVREMVLEGGAGSVAYMLEETGRVIKSMQYIVDELISIDALISSAADRVLSEAGL